MHGLFSSSKNIPVPALEKFTILWEEINAKSRFNYCPKTIYRKEMDSLLMTASISKRFF